MIIVEIRVPKGSPPLMEDEVTCVDVFVMRTIRKDTKVQDITSGGEKRFQYISDWDETSIKVFWKLVMCEGIPLELIIRERGKVVQ